MDVIANNIANMNTPSYKGEKMMFVEYLVEPQKDQPLSFVQDFGMIRDMTEGPLASTNNPLDMAISGDGFFTVETENGARYTRSGRFQLDREGQIVNQLGHPLLTAGGQPILVPSGSGPITIASDECVPKNKNGLIFSRLAKAVMEGLNGPPVSRPLTQKLMVKSNEGSMTPLSR